MTGDVESLSDPSYKNQILVLTYPLIGNYGVPNSDTEVDTEWDVSTQPPMPKYFESDRIHATGLIVGEYCDDYSHWNATKSLSQWLVESNVPAIHGIDTRKLTKILRENGSMLAKVNEEFKNLFPINLHSFNLSLCFIDFHQCQREAHFGRTKVLRPERPQSRRHGLHKG